MKLRIVKFESKTCGVCISMNKRRVLENVKEEFPSVEIVSLCIANKYGESPPGSAFEEAFNLSDVLGAEVLPTFIIQDERGVEVARLEGDNKVADFRKTFKALEEKDAFDTECVAVLNRVLHFKTNPQE